MRKFTHSCLDHQHYKNWHGSVLFCLSDDVVLKDPQWMLQQKFDEWLKRMYVKGYHHIDAAKVLERIYKINKK
jgi:hypothetical protein